MNYIQNKKIGIWGYGKTGIAAITYFQEQGAREIHVYNDTPITSDTLERTSKEQIFFYVPHERTEFLASIDYLFKSPGVPVYENIAKERCLIEFDLLRAAWKNTIIGITGTIGKTSVTSILSQLLEKTGIPSVTGGNIGTPMLELINTQSQCASSHIAVIELSSFHLEQGIKEGPDIALITNIYPNHLDRHKTIEAYTHAKLQLILAQHSDQHALLPLQLAPLLTQNSPYKINSQKRWFSVSPPTTAELSLIGTDPCYFIKNTQIQRIQHGNTQTIGSTAITTCSFPENILILTAMLDIMQITVPRESWNNLTLPPHRLAPAKTYNNIVFYNDSKSTIPEATKAAVAQLPCNPEQIVLFIGGTSKGVNRKHLIHDLPKKIKHVLCFGKEAQEMSSWCSEFGISATAHATLEDAFATCMTHAIAGDHILFSPAGASYDLFKHYEARGERFLELIQQFTSH